MCAGQTRRPLFDMNILLHRVLPPHALETLRQIAPSAEFRVEPGGQGLEKYLDWAQVIFGNPPAQRLLNRPNLRWLQIVSSGFDEYHPLRDTQVIVTTSHGVHARPIAQQVIMAMLMFARGQPHFSECQRAGKWDRNPAIPFRLAGQTVGLVGFGLIGQELARYAPLLGVRLIAVKRTPATCPPELARLDSLEGLDRLLQESDHVVVTLPLTSHTRNLLDAGRIARLKTGAYFYNVARGGLADEGALLERLRDGTLAGAALDVFAQEPLPPDSPWWTAPRTLVFPHIAGHHRDLALETFELFAENLGNYVQGRPLRNQADFTRGY
jgi:phosphoglycerate dehydrogenase-like enzyme